MITVLNHLRTWGIRWWCRIKEWTGWIRSAQACQTTPGIIKLEKAFSSHYSTRKFCLSEWKKRALCLSFATSKAVIGRIQVELENCCAQKEKILRRETGQGNAWNPRGTNARAERKPRNRLVPKGTLEAEVKAGRGRLWVNVRARLGNHLWQPRQCTFVQANKSKFKQSRQSVNPASGESAIHDCRGFKSAL